MDKMDRMDWMNWIRGMGKMDRIERIGRMDKLNRMWIEFFGTSMVITSSLCIRGLQRDVLCLKY